MFVTDKRQLLSRLFVKYRWLEFLLHLDLKNYRKKMESTAKLLFKNWPTVLCLCYTAEQEKKWFIWGDQSC